MITKRIATTVLLWCTTYETYYGVIICKLWNDYGPSTRELQNDNGCTTDNSYGYLAPLL